MGEAAGRVGLATEDPTGAIPSQTSTPVATPPSGKQAAVKKLLEDYGQAVLRLVAREEIIEKAQRQVTPLRADVERIARELADVGVPVPSRKTTKTARPATGGETIQDRAIQAVKDGANTTELIVDATGLTVGQVQGALSHLAKAGRLHRTAAGLVELPGVGDE